MLRSCRCAISSCVDLHTLNGGHTGGVWLCTGFDGIAFSVSQISPGWIENWQIWLGSPARWWNTQIKVNPTEVHNKLSYSVLFSDWPKTGFAFSMVKSIVESAHECLRVRAVASERIILRGFVVRSLLFSYLFCLHWIWMYWVALFYSSERTFHYLMLFLQRKYLFKILPWL